VGLQRAAQEGPGVPRVQGARRPHALPRRTRACMQTHLPLGGRNRRTCRMLPGGEQPQWRAAGTQVMPYSTGCCTPLSNFEAGLNYKDVSDPAVMARARRPLRCGAPGPQPACRSSRSPNRARGAHLVECRRAQVAFQLVDDPDNAEMIAWTTTPWRAPPPRHGRLCGLQGASCRGMAAPSARATS